METNNLISNKIIYNFLNLDYPNKIINYENQTNKTVCKVMNHFIDTYKDYFNNKIFILISQDDIYSLIAYNILKNIQGTYSFNLKIFGKRKKLKKHIPKKEFISKMKINSKKIKQDIIFISSFNPIYKVENNSKVYKDLGSDSFFKIIDIFTPMQFYILSNFYSIKDQNLLKDFKKEKFLDFKWFTLHNGTFQKDPYIFNNEYFINITNKYLKEKEIYLIKFSGNNSDFPIFDNIIKTDNICLYFFNKEKEKFLETNLNPYINSMNCINEDNTNNIILARSFIQTNIKYKFLGEWTKEEKEKILRGD